MQVMTSNKVATIETEKAQSSKTKGSTVTDDVNTESYHTSGIIRFLYFKYRYISICRSYSNDE